MIHLADPAIEDTVKRSAQPYFVPEGNACALLATKDHINRFVFDLTVPDTEGYQPGPRQRHRTSNPLPR